MARQVYSITRQLVAQSQDAALSGIQVFNNPSIRFKSETFIVLMNISWTYLLHAYYRREDVEYRYYKMQGKRRRFERTNDGSFRYWDLRRCLTAVECPLDRATRKNLLFLVGLRDEITHHMSPALDQFASARYQACCLNFNRYVKKLFGDRFGIDQHLTYSLQLQALSREQMSSPSAADLPPNVQSFIARFDSELSVAEMNSSRFAYRMLFVPKLVGKPGQADELIEFVKADSEIARSINRDYLTFKEVERQKYLPSHVVALMNEEGYVGFNIHHHTVLWQELDAKQPTKGYGVQVEGAWYWYESWVQVARVHCEENAGWYRRS